MPMPCHQAGRRAEAEACFRDAEQTQADVPALLSAAVFGSRLPVLRSAACRARACRVAGKVGVTPQCFRAARYNTQSPMNPLLAPSHERQLRTSRSSWRLRDSIQPRRLLCSTDALGRPVTLAPLTALFAVDPGRYDVDIRESRSTLAISSSGRGRPPPRRPRRHMIPRGLLTRALLCSLTGARTCSPSSPQAGADKRAERPG